MNETLKPCPFCGGNAKVMSREKHFLGWRMSDGVKVKSYFAYVICNRCHARGKPIPTQYSSVEPKPYHGRYRKWFLPYVEKAAEAWNRRSNE